MTSETFSRAFKAKMRDHLMADVLASEIKHTNTKFSEVVSLNNAVSSEQNVVGFYYLGNTYDKPGRWKAWAKRIPLADKLFTNADDILAELATLAQNKRSIQTLITQALLKSKSLGDMFALLPDGYHNTMRTAIEDYRPGSTVTLTKEEIMEFLNLHEPVLVKFRQYIMLRLITT